MQKINVWKKVYFPCSLCQAAIETRKQLPLFLTAFPLFPSGSHDNNKISLNKFLTCHKSAKLCHLISPNDKVRVDFLLFHNPMIICDFTVLLSDAKTSFLKRTTCFRLSFGKVQEIYTLNLDI